MGRLETLPPELYEAIIAQTDTSHHSHSVWALSNAIPRSPVPTNAIYAHIRLTHAPQIVKLILHLRKSPEIATRIKTFAMEAWIVDADVAINLIRMLPTLKSLTIFMGTNFAPEHMLDLFNKPMMTLKNLNIRFRPYVQRASYYHFLKGAYFDSMLTAISKWPTGENRTISLVQDPLDPDAAKENMFAQPIVFFHLDPFVTLVRSPYFRNIKFLRLRLPTRQIVPHISVPGALPSLEFLDLSTCHVSEKDINPVLERLVRLRHLVLDGCGVVRSEQNEADWEALGVTCATSGVQRAREREKKLRIWMEENYSQLALVNSDQEGEDELDELEATEEEKKKKKRPGRSGLGTSTVSIRKHTQGSNRPRLPRIRILPMAPSLKSLTITAHSAAPFNRYPAFELAFQKGYQQGIHMQNEIRSRIRISHRRGTRVLRFEDDYQSEFEEGFAGLEDIKPDFSDWYPDASIPVLCLAGGGKDSPVKHADGCAHQEAWRLWEDQI